MYLATMKPLIALTLLLTLLTCTENPAPASAPEPVEPVTPAAPTSLPSIPIDSLEFLWNNATYLDATFYNIPASINQSELSQIRSSITYIAEQPAQMKPECKPAGHVWFQVNGKNRQEADIYFSPGCTYYVWFQDKKPVYSNELTEAGIGFYNNIIRSVQGKTQQQ